MSNKNIIGEAESPLISRNRTTLPRIVREALGLKGGERLVYKIDEKGEVRLEKAVDIRIKTP